MADIIDILVVVDAQSIMKFITDSEKKHEMDVNNPIFLGDETEYIHMLTQPNKEHYISGQGTSELQIKAKNNDVIRWRGITLSKDSDYSAALLNLSPAGSTTQKEANMYFNLPVVNPIHSYVSVLKSDNPISNPKPLEVDLQEAISYYWETSVKKMPPPKQFVTEAYAFTIGIYDNGITKAYVTWDPSIVLDNR
ncbi:AidA/PixA family protein [Xenorhabdus bovienii]|uniref:AidA/PixA family protein n=1 Tax=Xenorhabdus bovienii TaxID=40576 RepID=UPI0023B2A7B1|nr:AidA/PixA family protein [Xenorhabdus bovienii]MDE9430175.1 inclusion body family protein [Xenorhabdus bovienii]